MSASTTAYPVFYNPALAEERRQLAKRALIGRFISLGISVIISGVLWWFLRDQIGGFVWLLVLGLVVPLGFIVKALVNLRRAGQELRAIHEGVALVLARDGLQVEDAWLPWTEVGRLQAQPRSGRSNRLVVSPRQGQSLEVPLDYLTVLPATLDGGVRAMSGGRCHVDFGPLGL
ncbi:hypothetical protein [Nigerium massiliense]|uniref:hypothetical protein n=1 Tax=Nigerium massiliense TaxID=1522317 RepID=UPI00058D8F61|nr:hypothetical protein [Nigerium massiliense]